jgi:hypothetical protein
VQGRGKEILDGELDMERPLILDMAVRLVFILPIGRGEDKAGDGYHMLKKLLMHPQRKVHK